MAIRPSQETDLFWAISPNLGDVSSVALTSDGRTLASAGEDGTVLLWDVADRARPTRLATMRGHTAAVLSVALTPDGRTLASAGEDGTVQLWDISDRRPSS